MVDIRHRIGIRAPQEAVYAALVTREGVAGWWSSGTQGDGGRGGRLTLPFRAPEPYVVLFTHEGWAEPVEFLHHCSTKWAAYLFSLRELVERGAGRPGPYDLKIDDWD
jgi:hypothetical protein